MADEHEGADFVRSTRRVPPKSFDTEFDPRTKERFAAVTASMEADRFYVDHNIEECRIEWRARYDRMLEEER